MAEDDQTQNQPQEQEQGQDRDAEQMELEEEEERDGQMFEIDQQRITLVCAPVARAASSFGFGGFV